MPFPLRNLLLLFLSMAAHSAWASHILGGDIAYESVAGAPNQFKVTVRLYRDIYSRSGPVGVNFNSQIRLICSRAGCAPAPTDSVSVLLQRNELIEKRVQNCAGSFIGLQYEVHVFEGLVTLPPATWLLHIAQENRTFEIYNIIDSGSKGFHIEALLNNTSPASQPNSSPRFTTLTLPALCLQQTHNYSFSAFDADGDSLTYESVPPLAGREAPPQVCGTLIPYATYGDYQVTDPTTNQTVTFPGGQFSAAFPLLSVQVVNGQARPLFQLNPATGELTTRPVQAGLAAVVVRVTEYRRLDAATPRVWTRIGSVMRDVIYRVVVNSSNHNPGIVGVQVAGSSSQLLRQRIPLVAGQTTTVTLTSADADAGQSLQLSTDAGALVPGLSLRTEQPGQAVLTWNVPATLRPGRYPLAVTVSDNACPINGSEVYTLVFEVAARSSLAAAPSKAQKAASAYPQPFEQQIQFRAAPGPVIIIDGMGRVVAWLLAPASGLGSWRPAPTVAPGIYFAKTADAGPAIRLVYAGH